MTDIFSIKDFKLPEGFIWGSSTAGHQIEGNNIHSAHWYNEQERLKLNPEAEVSGMACNHYNMVREDVDRENGFKRTIKPSAYFYKEIIENNGFSQEILRKYFKETPRCEYL